MLVIRDRGRRVGPGVTAAPVVPITPLALSAKLLSGLDESFSGFRIIGQGGALVREGERCSSSAGEPAIDFHNWQKAVLSTVQHHVVRLKAVRRLEDVQPSGGVEKRGVGKGLKARVPGNVGNKGGVRREALGIRSDGGH